MKSIKDVEKEIEERISEPLKQLGLLADGYRCSVRLRGKARRKRQSAPFEKRWSPDTDRIEIKFEPVPQTYRPNRPSLARAATAAAPQQAPGYHSQVYDPVSDLVHALDRAESRPGYDFVALKWFRDTALLSEDFPWVTDDLQRRNLLRDAIDRRLILTSKVPNPKSPQFPVTAIRLNRLMPEVKKILGETGDGASDFRPVPIRGENLSVTVLRDRR